jgi:hypothetical protein
MRVTISDPFERRVFFAEEGGGATAATVPDEAESSEGGEWMDSLSDEMKKVGAIQGLASMDEVVNKLVNAEAMLGKDKVVVPGADSTDEERNAFHKALGRPDSPDGYEAPTEGLPEGAVLDADLMKQFFAEAHEMGLNKQQTARLIRFQANVSADMQKVANDRSAGQRTEWGETLKTEFGEALEESVALARKAVAEFGGDQLKSFMDDSGLGDHPELVKAFAKIGKAIASDEIMGEGSGRSFRMTPVEADAAIRSKQLDSSFMEAYVSRSHPAHDAAVKEMQDLFAAKNPEPAVA